MKKHTKVFMWYKIKQFREKGLSRSQIGLELGIYRGTVANYLSMTESEFIEWIKSPRHLPKKLSSYHDFIKDLLDTAPYLSSAQVEDRLKENFDDLPDVSSKTIYNFVNNIREQYNIPKKKEKLPRQYAKLPERDYGEEAQVDFGSYRMLTKGSGREKIYFFVMVLSRSRKKFVYCQQKPFTTATTVYAHELAFKYFTGIPRKIMYDQDRVLITDENLGDVLLTDEFMQFTSSYPFEAVFCRKSDPESKGKVENVVKYVKYNYFKGRVFHGIESLQQGVIAWLKRTANAKIHQTTQKVPDQEWEIEKHHLLPYNNTPQKPILELKEYTVRKDNTILFRSNFYSLPLGTYKGANTKILLEEKQGELFLYSKTDTLLASHIISTESGKTIRNTDHKREKSKSLQRTHELVLNALGNSSTAESYLSLIENDKPRYYHDNLKAIQKYIDDVSKEIIDQALSFCLENNILNGYRFADVLKYYQKEQAESITPLNIDASSLSSKTNIENMIPQTSNIQQYESIM